MLKVLIFELQLRLIMQWQNKKMVLLFHIIPLILLAEENILFGTKFLVNTILS